jgi:hypothetical protein
MRQVIEGVWSYYASIRDAERARRMAEEAARRAAIETAEAERRAVIEAALARIPLQAHEIPLTEIGLSARVLGHLERAELATVADVMGQLAEGDEGLLKLDGIGPKSLAEVRKCIEMLSLPVVEEAAPIEEEVAAEEGVELEAALPTGPVLEEAAAVAEEVAAVEEEEAEPALEVAPEVAVEEAPPEEAVVEKAPVVAEFAEALFDEEFEEEEVAEVQEEHKRERRLRRELVYDEELGEVVAVRRRKKGDDIDQWEEYLK